MRRTWLALVVTLVFGAVIAGCADGGVSTGTAAGSRASKEPDDTVRAMGETAARFALAVHFGDSKALAAMIDESDASEWADEIATIRGSVVNPDWVSFEWVDAHEVNAYYGDTEATALVDSPEDIFCGSSGAYMSIALRDGPSRWVVDTVDGYPAVRELRRMSVSGRQCLANLETVKNEALAYRVASDDYELPGTLEELAAGHGATLPTCPAGGAYLLEIIDSRVVVRCTVHGERGY